MKIIFVDCQKRRRELEINPASCFSKEEMKLFRLVDPTPNIKVREYFPTTKVYPLKSATNSHSPSNYTAGSVWIAHYNESKEEVFSENIQVRSDLKSNCIDIEVFFRSYYPKEDHRKVGPFSFHNILIEDAKQGFIIGYEHDGVEYLTLFTPEKVDQLLLGN